MPKAVETVEPQVEEALAEEKITPEIDSKYRMIIVAAQRSKQLQRGARSRVEIDIQRHKPTRVALEEVAQKKIHFTFTTIEE